MVLNLVDGLLRWTTRLSNAISVAGCTLTSAWVCAPTRSRAIAGRWEWPVAAVLDACCICSVRQVESII